MGLSCRLIFPCSYNGGLWENCLWSVPFRPWLAAMTNSGATQCMTREPTKRLHGDFTSDWRHWTQVAESGQVVAERVGASVAVGSPVARTPRLVAGPGPLRHVQRKRGGGVPHGDEHSLVRAILLHWTESASVDGSLPLHWRRSHCGCA